MHETVFASTEAQHPAFGAGADRPDAAGVRGLVASVSGVLEEVRRFVAEPLALARKRQGI